MRRTRYQSGGDPACIVPDVGSCFKASASAPYMVPMAVCRDLSGNQLTDGIPDDWSVFQISISMYASARVLMVILNAHVLQRL